jgi:signal transduction histidine kinase
MINLLTNSLKFTPSGGVIKISAYVTDAGGFEISVEDNGMGISPEDLERVKQPFVQVADSMTRQHEGTGLGLAIVRSIAELHDADFNLESQVGVATKATFTLPASRVVG